MPNGFGQHLRIGVAPGGAALARAGLWRPGRFEVVGECRLATPATPEGLAGAVREILAASAPAGASVSFVLSDELVRIWLVHPPALCSRRSDLQAAAVRRFQMLFGGLPVGWHIAAEWNALRPFLAVAVPQALRSLLQQVVREYRGKVVQVLPQFVVALNQWSRFLRKGTWFGLVQDNVLRLALFDGEALAAIRCLPVPKEADRAWLEGVVAREALLVGVERPEQLYFCGSAPKDWASDGGEGLYKCDLLDSKDGNLSDLARIACTGGPRTNAVDIDFAEPSIRRAIFRTHRLAFGGTAIALAMLASVVLDYRNYARERSRFELQVAGTRALQHAPAGIRTVAAKPLISPEQAAAVNSAIMELNLPWRELHEAVQTATPESVALLSLAPDAKKGLLLITAETKNSDDMLAYVERLRGQDSFSVVTLIRHEINEQDPNRPVRFQVEAQWGRE